MSAIARYHHLDNNMRSVIVMVLMGMEAGRRVKEFPRGLTFVAVNYLILMQLMHIQSKF